MEFNDIEMTENVEQAVDVIEEIAPKKGFKLNLGGAALIGAAVTAAVIGVVALVKKARANKVEDEESVTEDDYEDDYETVYEDDYDSDVEVK